MRIIAYFKGVGSPFDLDAVIYPGAGHAFYLGEDGNYIRNSQKKINYCVSEYSKLVIPLLGNVFINYNQFVTDKFSERFVGFRDGIKWGSCTEAVDIVISLLTRTERGVNQSIVAPFGEFLSQFEIEVSKIVRFEEGQLEIMDLLQDEESDGYFIIMLRDVDFSQPINFCISGGSENPNLNSFIAVEYAAQEISKIKLRTESSERYIMDALMMKDCAVALVSSEQARHFIDVLKANHVGILVDHIADDDSILSAARLKFAEARKKLATARQAADEARAIAPAPRAIAPAQGDVSAGMCRSYMAVIEQSLHLRASGVPIDTATSMADSAYDLNLSLWRFLVSAISDTYDSPDLTRAALNDGRMQAACAKAVRGY